MLASGDRNEELEDEEEELGDDDYDQLIRVLFYGVSNVGLLVRG